MNLSNPFRLDPYFRPILFSGALVILFNTLIVLPLISNPLVSCLVGGTFSVYLFKREFQGSANYEFLEIKAKDALILGLGVGIFVGSVLSLIMAIKLQNPEIQELFMAKLNETMAMKSNAEMALLEEMGSMIYASMVFATLLITTMASACGAFVALPFISKKKQ